METILVIVTFVSLAMAIGMGLLVVKLLREERRRSDARVAALMELAGESAPQERIEPEAAFSRLAAAPEHAAERRPVVAPSARRPARGAASRPAPVLARPVAEDLEIRPATGNETTAELFAKPKRRSPWGARLAIIAPMAIVIGIGLFGATAPFDSALDEGAPRQQTTVQAAAARGVPLELLALRHTQQGGRFTVSGVVQNPRAGAALSRIVATVVVFGPSGTQLANGRAPLDFTTLKPGAESPFVIEVPVAEAVTRYRIGFRGEGGQVIEHVDRRTSADALARK